MENAVTQLQMQELQPLQKQQVIVLYVQHNSVLEMEEEIQIQQLKMHQQHFGVQILQLMKSMH